MSHKWWWQGRYTYMFQPLWTAYCGCITLSMVHLGRYCLTYRGGHWDIKNKIWDPPTPAYFSLHPNWPHSHPSIAHFLLLGVWTGEKGQGDYHLCPPHFYSIEQWPFFACHPDILSFLCPFKFWMTDIFPCWLPPPRADQPCCPLSCPDIPSL